MIVRIIVTPTRSYPPPYSPLYPGTPLPHVGTWFPLHRSRLHIREIPFL